MVKEASRRKFLQRVTASLAVTSTLSTPLFHAQAAPDDSDSFWQMIRWQFPFKEEKVPMNAANLCPSPFSVSERVSELTRDIDVDCSFNNRAKFTALLETSRAKVARHLGVSSDTIALVRNTSEANNVVNNGLALKPGDEVVLWSQNHPTNNVAWDVRAARFGLRIKRVDLPKHPTDMEQLIEPFEKAFTGNTRVLALTHVSNLSGLRLPVKELSQRAHRQGIHVHVDGAQSWGALDVNLAQIGCDSYAASAHKWFVGPKEVGVLYVKRDRIEDIWPNVVAPGWGNDVKPDVKGARKFESLGQRDDGCMSAVGTTADLHQLIGSDRVETRVYELARALKSGLKEHGAKLVTPEDPSFSGGVCIIEVSGERRQELLDRLYEEHGIAGSTSGGLRLCPHIYNTDEHVQRALDGVKKLRHLLA